MCRHVGVRISNDTPILSAKICAHSLAPLTHARALVISRKLFISKSILNIINFSFKFHIVLTILFENNAKIFLNNIYLSFILVYMIFDNIFK